MLQVVESTNPYAQFMRKMEYTIFLQAFKKICNIEDFNFSNDEVTTRIELKYNTKLFFELKRNPTEFDAFVFSFSKYRPLYPVDRGAEIRWLPILDVVLFVETWIEKEIMPYLHEMNAPDPLHELLKERVVLFGTGDDDGDFSADEKRAYKGAIESFRLELERQFKLSVEQQEYIVYELKYLSEKVDALNKRDFKSVALAIIKNIGYKLVAVGVIEGGKVVVTDMDVPAVYWEIVKGVFGMLPKLVV